MDLATIDDVFRAVDAGDVDRARGLRHRYRDLLRLYDDIGWKQEDHATEYAITMDPDALMRVLLRLNTRATELIAEQADGCGLDRDLLQTAVIASGACGRLLVQLAQGGQSDDERWDDR